MQGFVGRIRHNGFDLQESLGHFVVNVIKSYAVVGIAGDNHRFYHIAVLVADGMGLAGASPSQIYRSPGDLQ